MDCFALTLVFSLPAHMGWQGEYSGQYKTIHVIIYNYPPSLPKSTPMVGTTLIIFGKKHFLLISESKFFHEIKHYEMTNFMDFMMQVNSDGTVNISDTIMEAVVNRMGQFSTILLFLPALFANHTEKYYLVIFL